MNEGPLRRDSPPPARPFRAVLLAAAVSAAIAGCAVRPQPRTSIQPSPPASQPVAQVRLADLQPPVTLPAPATRAATQPSMDALEQYALGRDALITNRKQAAIDKLQAAADLAPDSAIVYRDLGYALQGTDHRRAEAAFRQALAVDPADADSRLQLARMLINGQQKRPDEAIRQLRLARLSPEYAEADGLSAVVDLLLGRLLEQRGYNAAALECYESVLKTLDRRSLQLRGRPELADLLQRPGVLTLRIADLAASAEQPDRAIELYELLQKQEPQAAAMLEMRIARAHMEAGRVEQATRHAFNVVETFRAGRASRNAFAQLYDKLGHRRALEELDRLKLPRASDSTMKLLRADLLLRADRPDDAIHSLRKVERFDLSAARLTVQTYLAADQRTSLLQELVKRTANQPGRWPAINRAWAVLTQPAQASPLKVDEVQALQVSPEHEAARQFVLAQLLKDRGRPVPAKRALAEAQKLNPQLVKSLLATAEGDIDISSGFAESEDLVDLLADYRDDPQLLNLAAGALLRQGQKASLIDALQKANSQYPASVVIASTYAQVLAADEQKGEAQSVLERAVQQAGSADELYMLANQYLLQGDATTSEAVLRRALQLDENNPSVCNDLGYVLVDQGRELDFAESLLWRAVGAEPDNPAYLDSLGWLLYKRSRFGEAAHYLEQAVASSDPADPVVLDHAGDALMRLEQPARARQRWAEAVEAIKQRGTSDPQLRLRIERKLRQVDAQEPVDLAPVAAQ